MKDAIGASKYEGPPAQASTTAILNPRNDPVLFQDAVVDAFAKEAGGIVALPKDQMTFHPVTNMEVVHPVADPLTPDRVEVLLDFLPGGLATVTNYNNSRGSDMLVHDIRGGKNFVPHGLVTARDLLRLLVEEEWGKIATRTAAGVAFNNIRIDKEESWLAAAGRLLQYYRASTVDPAMP